jgi:hypothetical protein
VEDQTEAHPQVWPGIAEESARFDERTLETRLYVVNVPVLDPNSGSQIVCKMALRVVQRWNERRYFQGSDSPKDARGKFRRYKKMQLFLNS